MKGQDPLHWLFVRTALMLIVVLFAANPIIAATNEAIQNSAQLQARRIASTINIMAGAPDGTTYTQQLPTNRCKIYITENFVTMKIAYAAGESTATASMIDTTTKISAPEEIDCKTARAIELKKSGNTLEIRKVN